VAIGATPTAKDYEVKIYYCKADDRDFTELAKRECLSANYAQALLRFNRDDNRVHPNLRQDPPRLEPGVPVRIPPLSVLEERYPHLIQGLKPMTTAPAGQSTPPPPQPIEAKRTALSPESPVAPPTTVSLPAAPVQTPVPAVVAPMPLQPPASPPIAVTPPTAPPMIKTAAPTTGAVQPVSTRRYVVQGQGEMIYDIARRNNIDRWEEIYYRNPGIEPSRPIPGGTTLQLP
jgi:hypothetical protein